MLPENKLVRLSCGREEGREREGERNLVAL